MKKLIYLGLLLVLFTACKEQRYTQQSPEIDTVKSVIKEYNAKNYTAVVSHFADTANIYFNSTKSFKPSELPNYHEQTDPDFSSRGFIDEDLEYEMVKTDKGNTWVNFWGHWQGTLAANEKKIELEIHLAFQFIDGKIVTEYGYWDASPIVLALQEIEANTNQMAIVKKMYEDVDKGDIPAFVAALDSNIVWNEAENFIYADKNPYNGPDAVVEGVFGRIQTDWETFSVVDRTIHKMDNSMILVTGRYKGKSNATGKSVNAQAAHVWTLKNGKAVRFQQYTDTKQVYDAFH